jgi:trigger factor
MRASASPMEGNRTRLSVEVDESELDKALDATVRRLSQQVRVPGFRPGHVPRRVLEARLGGAEALRRQAIEDVLPDLYAQAVADTELDPIAAPEIDLTSGADKGPLTFDAVVEVRPVVSVAGYAGLVVTVPRPVVADADVDAQVDRLREQSGELEAVGRPAADGDYVTIDIHGRRAGSEDLDLEDFLYEVGSASAVPGLDEQLTGAKAGDILEFTSTLPGADAEAEPGGAEGPGVTAPGSSAQVRVLVKEVKRKVLPEPTDEWASEASEFATVAELRDDISKKLLQLRKVQAQMALRERTLAALVELVDEDPPPSLVESEVRERLHDLGHRLEARRMTVEQFLAASGRDEESLLAEIRAEAARAVRADLAMRALADAEAVEVDDDELDQAIAEMAEEVGTSAAELRRRLEHAGRLSAVRSDRRKAKALAWLLEHVELVDEDGSPVSRDELRVDGAGEGSAGGRGSSQVEVEAVPGAGAQLDEADHPGATDHPVAPDNADAEVHP